MKHIFFTTAFVIIAIIGNAQQQPKTSDARRLLEVSGSANLGMQVMSNMIASFKKSQPEVPTEFWDEFMKEVKPDDLINMLAPIYEKHLAADEIKKLIEFYESPLGKKLVDKLPLISRDSYKIGEKWGEEMGNRVIEKMKEKGYLKAE